MEKELDLAIAGHFALDTIVIPSLHSKSHSLGGGVTYGSLSAANYDGKAQIGIVSRVGEKFNRNHLSIFDQNQINLSGIRFAGPATTKFELQYSEGTRTLKLRSRAPNITLDDFPDSFLKAKAIHLTPIANEFSQEFLKELSLHEEMQNTLFGIDVQGLIRGFQPDGTTYMKNGAENYDYIYDVLKKFGPRMFFKAADIEAVGVTHERNLIKATEKLGETGANIFTTLGKDGLYFKAPSHPIIHLNAYQPTACLDETGAGDCFMAVLLLELTRKKYAHIDYSDIINAAKIASAASSFLIEKKGPCGFQSREAILERVKKGEEIKANL